jgi:hypothetical protein
MKIKCVLEKPRDGASKIQSGPFKRVTKDPPRSFRNISQRKYKMAKTVANQTDLNPGTAGNSTGIHFHGPNGQSANAANNPSDFPAGKANASGALSVTKTIVGTQGVVVRFSNPS